MAAIFDVLRDVLTDGEKPQSTAAGICDWRALLYVSRRGAVPAAGSTRPEVTAAFNATYMQRSEETGPFKPATVAAAQPLASELRQFCHCFQSAFAGAATDWLWLGKGPWLNAQS